MKNNYYLRRENKVNKTTILPYSGAFECMYNIIENNEKLFSIISNLQNHYHFKLGFQKKWTDIQEASD